jgi:hypothetical protein
MRFSDIFSLIATGSAISWGLWKILFKDFPPKPRKRETNASAVRDVLFKSIVELQRSIDDDESQIVRLEKLLRLAQQERDGELMQELLMMYSEHVEAAKRDKERLAEMQHMFMDISDELAK